MRTADVQFVLARVDAAVAPIHQTLDAINSTLQLLIGRIDHMDATLGTLVDSIADLRTELAAHMADGHGGEA